MSRSLGGLLLLVVSPAWALPPNPFLPHVSPCDSLSAQLGSWAVKGVIHSTEINAALMLGPQGAWRRIKSGSELFKGTQIEIVGEGFVVAKLAPGCPLTTYRWEIKGKTHAMDAGITVDAGAAIHKPGR
ncbi:HofP DNA utilization family protein [Buttiauxella sp.]|uniref:HofP DNA utilization family protein n=1 Tax=Buttiauxella sp. TaxID=1972222 RepID=UPI003C771BB2